MLGACDARLADDASVVRLGEDEKAAILGTFAAEGDRCAP